MALIVDTHCHLIYRERLRYPWLAGVPALNHDFPLDRYSAEAGPAGIGTVLHMEVDVAETDIRGETDFIGGLGLAGLVAACRPESPEFEAYLEWAVADKRIRGFRRILHTQPDDLGLGRTFLANLRRIGERGFPFDLCLLARQLPIGLTIARACPGLQFVLDHCGNPDVATGALDPWRDDVAALARLPNVACKVSGIIANAASTGWTAGDLRSFVEHIIDVFGWDRVVWGSDWPVCTLTGNLTRWVAATREIVATASEDEQDRLFSRNARRIYGMS